MKRWRNWLIPLVFAFLLSMSGCAGTGPGDGLPVTPPAGPIELPSALQFPSTVEVDLARVAAETGNALSAQVMPGGQFSDEIIFGAEFSGFTNSTLNVILADLHELDIPVGPDQNTFEGTGTLPGGPFFGLDIKIDFADFDLDGNGIPEGCTGSTCPVVTADAECPAQAELEDLQPVCFRIWADKDGMGNFVRLMAGRFDIVPIPDDPLTGNDEENPGVGRLITGMDDPELLNQAGLFGIENFFIEARYDHNDPLKPFDKSSELLVTQVLDAGDLVFNGGHLLVDQVALPGATSEDQVIKTIAGTGNGISVALEEGTVEYLARFQENDTLWSGSLAISEFAGPLIDESIEEVTAACAEIATGDATDRQNCIDLGIDVGGEPFIDAVSEGAISFPADFPATPTFP